MSRNAFKGGRRDEVRALMRAASQVFRESAESCAMVVSRMRRVD